MRMIPTARIWVATAAVSTALLGLSVAHAANPFEVTTLPDKRNLHGSAVLGDFVHVISGDEPQPKGFTNSVLTARINDDLSLGSWQPNRPLPINLIYIGNNVLVVQDHLYVVGGQEVSDIPGATNPGSQYNSASNNTAVFARVGPDGKIEPWKRSGRYAGDGGEGTAAATDGRFLYVTGGLTKSGSTVDDVFYAPILRDGSVGPWLQTASLPTPLRNHSAYFHNGTIYTFGGRTTREASSITNNVYTGSVNDDGTITRWAVSPMRLAFPVELATACAADDYLFLFCGRDPSEAVVERIQFSSLTPDGISPWGNIPTTMAARIYSSAALDRNRRVIYITGGRFSSNYADINERAYGFPLRPASAPATRTVAVAANAGFLEHEEAFDRARSENKPLFLVVYSNGISFTRADFEALASSSRFTSQVGAVVLGMMDASENPDVAKNLGLIRVPSYLMIGPDGSILRRTSGRRSETELLAFVAQK